MPWYFILILVTILMVSAAVIVVACKGLKHPEDVHVPNPQDRDFVALYLELGEEDQVVARRFAEHLKDDG